MVDSMQPPVQPVGAGDRWFVLRAALAAAALLALTGGCGQRNAYQRPPPRSVSVSTPLQQDVTIFLEETGTTEAVEYVEIRARVKGFLQTIHFKPGDDVKEGDPLYEIDPKPFQAILDQRKAALGVARAEFQNAEVRFQRAESLLAKKVIAQEERDERLAEREVRFSQIAAAEAAVREAELELSYCKIASPIDGRVGKTLVYEGNLVGSNESTHLTTVVKYHPIFARFSIPERQFLAYLDERGGGGDRNGQGRQSPMYLRRATDRQFRFRGEFNYADLAVDESTGTYMVRGEFPNPDLLIVPGLFVRIRVPIGTQTSALLVPERAVGASQEGRFLLVVDSENKVERRDVRLGTKVEEYVVIEEGLQPDETVIIDGVQLARPGAEVKAEPIKLDPPEQGLVTVEEGGGPKPEDLPNEPVPVEKPVEPLPKEPGPVEELPPVPPGGVEAVPSPPASKP